MGKAAVELDDPPPSAGVNPANADELLSQMAGDEIDRLLAEADVEPTEAAPADPAAAAETQSAKESASEVIDSAALAPQLDALFDQLEAAEASEAQELQVAPAPRAKSESAAAEPTPARAAFAKTDAAPAVAERVVAERVVAERVVVSPATPQSSPLAQASAHLLDLLLLPLRLINEPFEGCSDSLRQGLGWVGIVTTINALAVLAYVLLFRRH